MRKYYDFDKMESQRNPNLKQIKKPITIRLDEATITYFKTLANELGIPYQNLINLFLRDCALNKKKPALKWAS
jgi:predicted DNA binding CopG/RHH family protein